jgi:cation diffusion facilitator CzcD-associated flavoprotein CzcO
MTMRAAGLEIILFEKADSVGSVWRRHYDRLHLHTDRKHSGLPGMVMPRTYPLYHLANSWLSTLKATLRNLKFGQFSTRRFRVFGVTERNGAWTRAKAPSRQTSWSLQRA